ncbi:hypothetical protein Pmi06nite_79350 [Planotetraspora mira]|uniref:Transposase n=1 Tax=Planotetraspora mira TaxID=58121 RepID=A0A8J3TWQ4_9ACTN|nr:hypothetical protein Pmi06nite_79350 [Planotetraspora mira]
MPTMVELFDEPPRLGGGRPRTRPDRVLADKAYTSKTNRAYLRRHGIKATIPSKAESSSPRSTNGSDRLLYRP